VRTFLGIHDPCFDILGGTELDEILGIATGCFKDKDHVMEVGKGSPDIGTGGEETVPVFEYPLLCIIKDRKFFFATSIPIYRSAETSS
jgi:hypothetical protein